MYVKHLICVLGAAALTLPSISTAATTTFSDGTFDNASLTVTPFSNNLNSDISSGQVANLGNPGSAYEFDSTAGVGQFTGAIYVMENTFSYDPAVQGVIETISYSEDYWDAASVPFGAGGATLIVEQNGIFFVRLTSGSSTPSTWNSVSATGLVATSFFAFGATLDFSKPMEFGFTQGWNGTSNEATTFTSRVDNFNVEISAAPAPVPEPSSIVLLLCGFGVMRLMARKSKR